MSKEEFNLIGQLEFVLGRVAQSDNPRWVDELIDFCGEYQVRMIF